MKLCVEKIVTLLLANGGTTTNLFEKGRNQGKNMKKQHKTTIKNGGLTRFNHGETG